MDLNKLLSVTKKSTIPEKESSVSYLGTFEILVERITQFDSIETSRVCKTGMNLISFEFDWQDVGHLIKRMEFIYVDEQDWDSFEHDFLQEIGTYRTFSEEKNVLIEIFKKLDSLDKFSKEYSKRIRGLLTPRELLTDY